MQEIVGHTRMVGGIQSPSMCRHHLSRHEDLYVRINIKVAICRYSEFQIALINCGYGLIGDLDDFLHARLHHLGREYVKLHLKATSVSLAAAM
jgi:hypothetical protein